MKNQKKQMLLALFLAAAAVLLTRPAHAENGALPIGLEKVMEQSADHPVLVFLGEAEDRDSQGIQRVIGRLMLKFPGLQIVHPTSVLKKHILTGYNKGNPAQYVVYKGGQLVGIGGFLNEEESIEPIDPTPPAPASVAPSVVSVSVPVFNFDFRSACSKLLDLPWSREYIEKDLANGVRIHPLQRCYNYLLMGNLYPAEDFLPSITQTAEEKATFGLPVAVTLMSRDKIAKIGLEEGYYWSYSHLISADGFQKYSRTMKAYLGALVAMRLAQSHPDKVEQGAVEKALNMALAIQQTYWSNANDYEVWYRNAWAVRESGLPLVNTPANEEFNYRFDKADYTGAAWVACRFNLKDELAQAFDELPADKRAQATCKK